MSDFATFLVSIQFLLFFAYSSSRIVSFSPNILNEIKQKKAREISNSYVDFVLVHGGVDECGSRDFPGIYTRIADPEILQFILGTVFPPRNTTFAISSQEKDDFCRNDRDCRPSQVCSGQKKCVSSCEQIGKIAQVSTLGSKLLICHFFTNFCKLFRVCKHSKK